MAEAPSGQSPPQNKSPILGLLLLLGILILIGIPVFQSYTQMLVWRRPQSDNWMQGLTLLAMILAWLKTHPLKNLAVQPDIPMLGLVFLIAVAHVLGAVLGIKFVYWGSYLWLCLSLLAACYGRQMLLKLLPFGLFSLFLLPMMPTDLKMAISLPLQLLSTQLTTGLASLLIPITAKANIFYINGQAFEVTVACSGLNTWIGFLFAGLLWLLFEVFSWKKLGLILLLSPVMALLTNTIRLLLTALTAWYASAETAIAIHTNLEYIFFPLGLVLMLKIGQRYGVID